MSAEMTLASASTSYVRSWVDAKGGCKPAFRELATMPHMGKTEFLGRKPEEWTDEMVEEYEQVFVDCMLEVNTPSGMRPAPRGQRSSMYEETGRDKAEELKRTFVERGRAAQRQKLAQAEASRRQAEMDEKARADRAAKAAEEERIAREDAQLRARQRAERQAAEEAEHRARSERQAREAAEQAERDREAAAEIKKQADAERKRLAEAKRIADEARQAREAAEEELASIRREREAEEAKAKSESRLTARLRQEDQAPSPSASGMTNPFERSPDEFREAMNASLSSVGLSSRIAPGNCETTKAYRACEFEIDGHLIVVNGPMGGGAGTEKIMMSNEAGNPEDPSFVNAVGAIMSVYAPELSKMERTDLYGGLIRQIRSEGHKASRTVGGTYFSLLENGGTVDFFVIRE